MAKRTLNLHPFGELLLKYRLRKPGLSQRNLAELAGYDQAILVRMAQGKKDLTGPSGRERVVRLIETLANQGILTTLDEANELLLAANSPPLFERQPDEARLLTRLTQASTGHRVRRTNLPAPLTRFIGRTQEISEIRSHLNQIRLVTLKGPGGCGKTRLAQRVASDVLLLYPDGVWYVELAALTDPSLIAENVARVFGFTSADQKALDQLVALLRDKNSLLILDNCEHLINELAAFATQLLSQCAQLTILATSREALNVDGELTWGVPPMQLNEAIDLFIDRATLARPKESIQNDESSIADICNRLDGMPLAIELAAALLSTMSLSEILTRLNDRFALLTSGRRSALPRHQTLRALIDWSHDLLNEQERIVFRRLGVFTGGWTMMLAQSVVTAKIDADQEVPESSAPSRQDVLAILVKLAQKSLIITNEQGTEGETRYGYLETIRQYALERLKEANELERMQFEHAKACEHLAWTSDKIIQSPQQNKWFHKLDREFPNFRQAIDWSFGTGQHDELACNVFGGLHQFLVLATSYITEARRWCRLALEKMPASLNPAAQGYIYLLPSWVDELSIDESIANMRRAVACFERTADPALIALGKSNLGKLIARNAPDTTEGMQLLNEALTLVKASNDTWNLQIVLAQMGHVAAAQKEFAKTLRLFSEVRLLAYETDNFDGIIFIEYFIAITYMQELRFDVALPHLEKARLAASRENDALTALWAQAQQALIACYNDNLDGALSLGESALKDARERIPPWHCKLGLYVLARIYVKAAQIDKAFKLLRELFAILKQRVAVKRGWYGVFFDVVGCLAVSKEDPHAAALFFGIADVEFELVSSAAIMSPATEIDAFNGYRALYHVFGNQPYIDHARGTLGEEDYAMAYDEGRATSLESAISRWLAFAEQWSEQDA